MEIDKIYLQLNEPIQFYDVCVIYQPIIQDILKYKEEFNSYLMPYIILQEYKSKIEDKSIDVFDLLFHQENIDFMKSLINSIEYFCREKVYIDYINFGLKITGNEGILDKDNFNEFTDIILLINGKEKIEDEKEPINMSEKQKKVWEKLQNGRKRSLENNGVSLSTIINIVMYGGENYISSKQIKEMTMWQLTNAYKSILEKDSFYINFEQCLAGADSKNLDLTHWSQRLKIK